MRHIRRIARNPMAAIEQQFLVEIFAVRQHHAALSRRDDLDWVKAEHRHIRECATSNLRIEIVCSDSMRRIFRYGKTILLSKCMNALHITRLPSQMNRNDHLRKLSFRLCLAKLFFQAIGTHIVRLFINIDEIHIRAAITGAIRRSHKRDRTRPQNIVFSHPSSEARDMERGRGIRHCHSVLCPAIVRNTALKPLDRRTLCQKVRTKNRLDRLDVRLIDILSPIIYHGFISLSSSMVKKCEFEPESYEKPSGTRFPSSPNAFFP